MNPMSYSPTPAGTPPCLYDTSISTADSQTSRRSRHEQRGVESDDHMYSPFHSAPTTTHGNSSSKDRRSGHLPQHYTPSSRHRTIRTTQSDSGIPTDSYEALKKFETSYRSSQASTSDTSANLSVSEQIRLYNRQKSRNSQGIAPPPQSYDDRLDTHSKYPPTASPKYKRTTLHRSTRRSQNERPVPPPYEDGSFPTTPRSREASVASSPSLYSLQESLDRSNLETPSSPSVKELKRRLWNDEEILQSTTTERSHSRPRPQPQPTEALKRQLWNDQEILQSTRIGRHGSRPRPQPQPTEALKRQLWNDQEILQSTRMERSRSHSQPRPQAQPTETLKRQLWNEQEILQSTSTERSRSNSQPRPQAQPTETLKLQLWNEQEISQVPTSSNKERSRSNTRSQPRSQLSRSASPSVRHRSSTPKSPERTSKFNSKYYQAALVAAHEQSSRSPERSRPQQDIHHNYVEQDRSRSTPRASSSSRRERTQDVRSPPLPPQRPPILGNHATHSFDADEDLSDPTRRAEHPPTEEPRRSTSPLVLQSVRDLSQETRQASVETSLEQLARNFTGHLPQMQAQTYDYSGREPRASITASPPRRSSSRQAPVQKAQSFDVNPPANHSHTNDYWQQPKTLRRTTSLDTPKRKALSVAEKRSRQFVLPENLSNTQDVANLVARLSAINRDDPATALAQIDSILKQQQSQEGSGSRSRRIVSDSMLVQESLRSYPDPEMKEPESDDETSMSSITNPTYQPVQEKPKPMPEIRAPSTSSFRPARPSGLQQYAAHQPRQAASDLLDTLATQHYFPDDLLAPANETKPAPNTVTRAAPNAFPKDFQVWSKNNTRSNHTANQVKNPATSSPQPVSLPPQLPRPPKSRRAHPWDGEVPARVEKVEVKNTSMEDALGIETSVALRQYSPGKDPTNNPLDISLLNDNRHVTPNASPAREPVSSRPVESKIGKNPFDHDMPKMPPQVTPSPRREPTSFGETFHSGVNPFVVPDPQGGGWEVTPTMTTEQYENAQKLSSAFDEAWTKPTLRSQDMAAAPPDPPSVEMELMSRQALQQSRRAHLAARVSSPVDLDDTVSIESGYRQQGAQFLPSYKKSTMQQRGHRDDIEVSLLSNGEIDLPDKLDGSEVPSISSDTMNGKPKKRGFLRAFMRKDKKRGSSPPQDGSQNGSLGSGSVGAKSLPQPAMSARPAPQIRLMPVAPGVMLPENPPPRGRHHERANQQRLRSASLDERFRTTNMAHKFKRVMRLYDQD